MTRSGGFPRHHRSPLVCAWREVSTSFTGAPPMPSRESKIDRIEELTRELALRERDIEASRATLRLIVEASRIGIWDWRIPEDQLYWNSAMKKLWGYCCEGTVLHCEHHDEEHRCDKSLFSGTYEEFIKRIDKRDRARVKRSVELCFREGVPLSVQYRVRHPDGTTRSVDSRGSVLFDEDHRPVRMVGICIPVDEKRTEVES